MTRLIFPNEKNEGIAWQSDIVVNFIVVQLCYYVLLLADAKMFLRGFLCFANTNLV